MADGRIIIDTEIDNSGIEKGMSKATASASSQAAKLAAEYRKQGMSASDAFKQAWSEIERDSAAKGQQTASNWRNALSNISSGALKKLGTAITGIGTGIAAGLGMAVKSAADFDQSMANVYSVMAPDEVNQFSGSLKDLAITMGADTKYSATEAAQGIEELLKAGVSVTDIMNGGLKGALSLATAGELSLGDAAEIASTALNAFKNDNLSVQQAADILAGAANASATSVSELKFGLSSVSAVASSVGWSFKDTTTALAEFAQNGLKGQDAGTSLKTMLMNLQPTTDKARDAMKQLGIITADGSNKFVDAQGHFKSLAEISDVLQDSMSGLTDAQRLQYMQTMFGSDAIRAANILFKEGAKGANDMATAMGKVGADDVAAKKMDTLKGALEQLSGAFETAKISIGNALIPVVKVVAGALQSMIDGFNKMSPSMQSFIAISGLVAAAVLLIAGPILMLIGFLPAITAGFSLLMGPIGIAMLALTAFGAIAAVVIANWSPISTFFAGLWTGIITAVSGFVTAIVNFFTVTIPAVFTSFITFMSQLPAMIGAFFTQAFTAIVAWGANVLAWIATTIPNIITNIGTFFSELPGKIGYALGFALGTIVKWGVDAWNYLTTNVPKWIEGIGTWFSELPGRIWQWLLNAIAKIKEWGTNTYTTAVNFTTNTINGIVNWFAQLPGRIWSFLVNVISGITSWGANMVAQGSQAASNLVSSVVNIVSSLPGKMLSIGRNIVEGIWNGITGAAGWLKSKVSDFVGGIVDGFKAGLDINSPSRVMRDLIGRNIPKGIGVGIDMETPDLNKKIQNNIDDLTAKLRGTVDFETARTTAQVVARNNYSIDNTTVDNNDRLDKMADAIKDLAKRPIQTKLDIDGKAVAEATNEYHDNINGKKVNLTGRGLAL